MLAMRPDAFRLALLLIASAALFGSRNEAADAFLLFTPRSGEGFEWRKCSNVNALRFLIFELGRPKSKTSRSVAKLTRFAPWQHQKATLVRFLMGGSAQTRALCDF